MRIFEAPERVRVRGGIRLGTGNGAARHQDCREVRPGNANLPGGGRGQVARALKKMIRCSGGVVNPKTIGVSFVVVHWR